MAAASTPTTQATRAERSRHSDIERIALATGAAVEAVRQIYDHELQDLREAARIQQFVRVIATRRVLMRLRGAA